MKTAIVPYYGPPDVIRIVDTEVPALEPHEVLIRVIATSVTAGDSRIRSGRFPKGFAPFARLAIGLRGPRKSVLGASYSGVIEATGRDVTDFAPGDEVCGMGGTGAWAEFVRTNPAKAMVKKPATVSHDQAAAVLFGGTTSLHFLKDRAGVTAGQRVLINGAAGVVGSLAVQIARVLGAEVTGAARGSTLKFVKELGADHVIDYQSTPVETLTERFDVVLDTSGTMSIEGGRLLLEPDGKLILIAASLFQMIPRKRVIQGLATAKTDHIATLLALIEGGEIAPAIDSAWPLDEIVAANRRFETGGRQGVIIVHPAS